MPLNLKLSRKTDPIFAEKVQILYQNIPGAMLPAFTATIIYSAVVWSELPHSRIITWAFFNFFSIFGCLYLYRKYKQLTQPIQNPEKWFLVFAGLTYFAGAVWGSIAFFLLPEPLPLSFFSRRFHCRIYGWDSRALFDHAETRGRFYIPDSGAAVRPFYFIDDPLHRALLFIAPIYWLGLMMVSRQIHRSMTRALELNRELEETTLGLENRVSERTAELRTANAQLRQLTNAIEQSVELVVIIDLEEKIEYVNPMVERQSGYCAEELMGQDFQKFLKNGGESEFSRDDFEYIREGGEWRAELEHVTKSGKTYITEMTMSPIYDDDHTITHFLAIMREMTKRNALEQSLLQSSKLSSLGVLISGIAHELNTPLATIRGFSSRISKEKGLGKEVKQYADWVVEESERCVVIVKNLLGFSRKYEPNTSLFDLNEIISGVIKLYHHPLKSDLIQVAVALEKRPLIVKGDSDQLQQVVLNIFQNARKAIQQTKLKGRITIRTCRGRIEKSKDNGPVMKAHIMIENQWSINCAKSS